MVTKGENDMRDEAAQKDADAFNDSKRKVDVVCHPEQPVIAALEESKEKVDAADRMLTVEKRDPRWRVTVYWPFDTVPKDRINNDFWFTAAELQQLPWQCFMASESNIVKELSCCRHSDGRRNVTLHGARTNNRGAIICDNVIMEKR